MIRLFTLSLTVLLSQHALCLGKVHNIYPFATGTPLMAYSQINSMFQGPMGKYMGTAYLYTHIFDGINPATHGLVIEHSDMESYQKTLDALVGGEKKDANAAMAFYMAQKEGIINPLASLQHEVIMSITPENWSKNSYLLVFDMAVKDPAKYAEAWKKLMTKTKKYNPSGSAVLVANIAGGGAVTHAVAISSNSYAQLMDTMNKTFSSDSYKKFQASIGDNRTVLNRSTYQRMGKWSQKD